MSRATWFRRQKENRGYSDWNEAIEAAMKIAAEDRYGRMIVNQLRSLKREPE